MRVLALDYGSARCGCAVSDPTGVLATPLDPVLAPGSKRGLGRLRALVSELGAERVVVGLPLSLSGADTAQTIETREFAARLEQRLQRSGRALRRALHDCAGPADRRQRQRGLARRRAPARELAGGARPRLGGRRWLIGSRAEREAARLERERRRAERQAASDRGEDPPSARRQTAPRSPTAPIAAR